MELTAKTDPLETSTEEPLAASWRLPPEMVPFEFEVMLPVLRIAKVPPILNWPPFTARLPESVVLAFVKLIEPARRTRLLLMVEADSASVPALVFVSVPPVTVELIVRSEPALTSTPLPAVARDREPPEIVPPPVEVMPEAAPKVSAPVEATVTAPPFTARLPESVLVPIVSVPTVVTAPNVLPLVKVAEAPEAMVKVLAPDRAVPKVSEPPLTDTEPVKPLNEEAFTATVPLVESAPVPLKTPVNVPPATLREPRLLTVPLVNVETTTLAFEPMLKLPVASDRTVLVPAPEIPTEPPLMPPARVAVPPILNVPVVTASVMDTLALNVVSPVLVKLVSEPLLKKLVVPVPLRLVAVTVPVAALKVSVDAFASAPKLPLATVNSAEPPVTFTALPPDSMLLTVKRPLLTFKVPL